MGSILGHVFTLIIADFTFLINSRDLAIYHESAGPYRQFISTRQSNTLTDAVTVELLLEEIPDVSRHRKIFDTKESWALYESDDKKYILFRNPGHTAQPMWVADVDLRNRHVDVYCSNRFISKLDNGQHVIINPLSYPLDQILLMQFLGPHGFTVHAAGAILHSDGFIFAGPSGAGKSTITTLLSNFEEFSLLSDDRIVVRKKDGQFSMYGTPWAGEAGIAVNSQVGLRKIFFLEKGGGNVIREINPKEALEKIMPVVSVPWYDKSLLTDYLDTCGKMLEHTKTYVLSFTPNPGSVDELISMFDL